MKNRSVSIIITFFYLITILDGCKKDNSFLNAKPNQALKIPSTLNDLQLLLANENVFNRFYPGETEASTDDFYLETSTWLNDYGTDRNAYVWAKDIYTAGDKGSDWVYPYQMVYNANIILEKLNNIKVNSNETTKAAQVKGGALFFRALAFYNLLQEFSAPYDSTEKEKILGIPLPLRADINAKVPRSTLATSYNQLIDDLNKSLDLLPDLPEKKTQASKSGALAMLSRTYLVMGNYGSALKYANQSLDLYNKLQDFNQIDQSAFPVFPNFSSEEIFHASMIGGASIGFHSLVDSVLYQKYRADDLRKAIFFYDDNGSFEFNSQFDKNNDMTYSLSTSELYLTKAECEARLNNATAALSDLNTLLITRYETGKYKAYADLSPVQALALILEERRKELVMTSIRWTDLRRLNTDSRFAITLKRMVNGTSYTLPPNDPRYMMPIPQSELQYNPIQQNNR